MKNMSQLKTKEHQEYKNVNLTSHSNWIYWMKLHEKVFFFVFFYFKQKIFHDRGALNQKQNRHLNACRIHSNVSPSPPLITTVHFTLKCFTCNRKLLVSASRFYGNWISKQSVQWWNLSIGKSIFYWHNAKFN